MASRLPRKPIDSSDTEFAYTSDNLFSFSLLLSCIGSHQGIHPPSWWLRSRELFSKRPGYNLLFIAARTKTKRKNEKKQGICMWGSPTTTSHGGEGGGRKEPHPSVRFLREKAIERKKKWCDLFPSARELYTVHWFYFECGQCLRFSRIFFPFTRSAYIDGIGHGMEK